MKGDEDGPAGCPLHGVDVGDMLAICRRTFQHPRPDGTLPRQFHEKAHACLSGTLHIDPPDNPALRHGLFAQAGRYPVTIRFSSSFFSDDEVPDGRGMAIRLTGVEGAPGGQQDFILISQATAPFRQSADAAALFTALDGVPRMTPFSLLSRPYILPGFDPRRIRWHYLRLLFTTGFSHARRRGLHRLAYHSITPYRLGESATKYICRPDAGAWDGLRGYRRSFTERLQAALDRGGFGFDFCLQPRLSESDPIDDAGVIWKGPDFPVGRLEISAQDVSAGLALSDGLAFNPWNSLPDHEPLGSLNAIRRIAYADSAKRRNAANS